MAWGGRSGHTWAHADPVIRGHRQPPTRRRPPDPAGLL